MKKRMIIMASSLLLVFGGIIGFNFFKSIMIKRFFAHYSPPPVSVSSVTAMQKSWQPHLAAVGNFVAVNGVDINAQTSGNVATIHFESGQYLAKGSPLIDIDDAVEQATLKFNQAELALRQLNFKRQTELFKRGAASNASLDEATATLQQAEANVERIAAEIQKKHITAPFSGQLGIRQVNLGQYITPGQTNIVTLQSLDPLYLEFGLPEHFLKYLHVDQTLQFSVEEYPNQVFEGKINAISSKIDSNTHNIQVQATLANCPAEAFGKEGSPLLQLQKEAHSEKTLVRCNSALNTANHVTRFAFIPGMFASLAILQPTIPQVVVLPSTAISYSLYGNSVFVIEQDKELDKEGKATLRAKRIFVSTGDQEGNLTIINKGIKPGQQVVSSGELKLKNGTSVVINNSVKLNEEDLRERLSQ
ncbi:MAG: efflux RND transporter periplasmic adaptor subunit [Tatlockia sp.]|jgi:membrane fusion protein (multidrug efflux system)